MGCTITLAFIAFAFFMLSMYSSRIEDCRSATDTVITLLDMAMGGAPNWVQFYRVSKGYWVVLAAFFVILVPRVLNRIAIAMAVSFKREMDLYEHHGYHPFWIKAKRQHQVTDKAWPKDFNPAEAGWDFKDKDPAHPEEVMPRM